MKSQFNKLRGRSEYEGFLCCSPLIDERESRPELVDQLRVDSMKEFKEEGVFP